MALTTVNGIVTRFTNYKENDRILTILTSETGRIDCKARGCRKPTSPLLPCSDSFVYGTFELFSTGEKYNVKACAVRETFFPIREDITRYAVGTAMLQLCSETAQENEETDTLFLLLYHALSFLSYGKSDPRDLFCCFLIRFLDRIGFRPSVTSCACCGRDLRSHKRLFFSPERGGALCEGCASGQTLVSGVMLESMRRMLIMRDEEMDRVKLPGETGKKIFDALCAYTCCVLEYGPRALAFLQDLV